MGWWVYLLVPLHVELPTRTDGSVYFLAGVTKRHCAKVPKFGAAEEIGLNLK